MKRYIYIIVSAALLAACDYNERNFPGLDELSRPENVIQEEITVTEAELPAVIAALNGSDIPEATLWAASLNREKAFSDEAPAESILPWYLRSLYYGADAGSVADVTYDRKETVTVEQTAFGENFEGYATVNATIEGNGWSQYRETGNYYWQAKEYDNWYAQIANGATGQKVTWLVSPEVDLADISDPKLSFDVKVGYYTATCLEIKISSDYTEGDPTAATWTDVTASFTLPTAPDNRYGDVFENAGVCDLSSHAGEQIRIAFRYNGDADADPKRTTTYQIDNITVSKSVPGIAPDAESVTGQFILSEAGWMFDPTIVKTFAKEDYQVLVDYVIRTHAVANPALTGYGNAEYYYGFSAYYGNITYREVDRVKDTAYPTAGSAEEKAAFMNARTVEGLGIFLAETMPDLQPEVNGVEQLARLKVLIYSDPLSDRQTVEWTYTLRCTAPGKWTFVERRSDDGTVETAP